MVISKKEFIRQSKFNKNTHAQSWSYYPAEYSCANNKTFKNQKNVVIIKVNMAIIIQHLFMI